MAKNENPSIDTTLIHAGEDPSKHEGAVAMPIYQSATYLYAGEASYGDVRYARMNNTPNHLVLHEKLAAIEHGEAALVMSSGMAAITTTLLTALKSGDHLLAQSSLYGGTHTFLTQNFHDVGLTHDFVDLDHPATWASKLKTTTRAFYVESITNPLIQVGDLEAVVKFAKVHNLVTIIDNTFASPVNFNPLDLGFDLVVHSATKYLNGHTDLAAGCVVGSRAWIDRIRDKANHFGGSLTPFGCYLLQRGLKTLALRVRRQNESALTLAKALSRHPSVERVNYPGLETHPQYQRARRWFRGFGGMLSFETKLDVDRTEAMLHRLNLAHVAPSLGGIETLVTRPATTSHAGLAPAERKSLGISDTLVRVSVGIEGTEDLVADFDQALRA
ncbi:MAG: aminotransferase class I/II-fold pyridoxal phosphate-dependent enzyme [Pseudomonadota bacterium]